MFPVLPPKEHAIMDKRKRNYILFLCAIGVGIFCAYLAKMLGFTIHSGLINAIITILFYAPIVCFLLYLSCDVRIKKVWRIILRILAIQMALANIVGIIIFWLN